MMFLLFIFSFFAPHQPQGCYLQPTPAAIQYMLNCVENGNSKAACYNTYWDAYQLGYGLEMPVVET